MKNKTIKILKFILVALAISLVSISTLSTFSQADVIDESAVSDTGDIGSSSIFTGAYKLIGNVAATLQWIIPIAGVCWILWYVFRIMTGDEQDQQRYKKGLVKVLICVVVAEIAVVLVNLIANYFI